MYLLSLKPTGGLEDGGVGAVDQEGLDDAFLSLSIFLNAVEVMVKQPWLRGGHGIPITLMAGMPS